MDHFLDTIFAGCVVIAYSRREGSFRLEHGTQKELWAIHKAALAEANAQ